MDIESKLPLGHDVWLRGGKATSFKVINIRVKGALRVGVRTCYGQLSEHIAICTLFLTGNICPHTIFPSFAYPIYTYYLYMKLHGVMETRRSLRTSTLRL